MNRNRRRLVALTLTGSLLTATFSTAAGIPLSAEVSPAQTQAVSVPDSGTSTAAAPAASPTISGNGRYVAFESAARLDPTVAAGPPGVQNIYVRDLSTPGHTIQITRAPFTTTYAPAHAPLTTSFAAAREWSAPQRPAGLTAVVEEGGNRDSGRPSISADGRYVAFESSAYNLPDGFPAFDQHVILCDRDPDGDGTFDERRPDGTMDYGFLYLSEPPVDESAPEGSAPSISADAGTVAWTERTSGSQTAEVVIAQVHKDPRGRPLAPDPTLFRRPLQDSDVYLGTNEAGRVSADGQHVVFTAGVACAEPSLARAALPACPPTGPDTAAVVFDLPSGQLNRIDYKPDGGYSGLASHPVVSGSGRLVAFEQLPRQSGPTITIVIDRDPTGNGHLGPADGVPVQPSVASRNVSGEPQEGLAPALSPDGRYLAFTSSADGMHADQQGTGRTAVILRDLTLDTEREKAGLPRLPGELGSPGTQCEDTAACPATGPSTSAALSADGLVLTFTSAGNDVLPDPCCAGAVFARTFRPTLTSTPPDFGTVAVGNTTTRTVVLQHTGFGPLPIGGITLTGAPDFTLTDAENCATATLHETDTCSLEITFTPTTTGDRQSVLRVALPDGAVSETPLVANSVPAPPGQPPQSTGALVITPNPVVFDGQHRVLVPTATQTIDVRNAATVPVTVTTIALLDGPRFTIGDFAIGRTTCTTAALDPGDTCQIDLTSTPQNAGNRDGVLRIGTSDPAYDKLISLHSQGIQPILTVSPAVVRLNRVVQVTGRDFPPNHPVTVTLATPGSRTLLNLQTTPDGTFTVPLLIFPQTSAGTSPVVATAGGTAVRAQAPLLIVPGSYQPPGFTSRR